MKKNTLVILIIIAVIVILGDEASSAAQAWTRRAKVVEFEALLLEQVVAEPGIYPDRGGATSTRPVRVEAPIRLVDLVIARVLPQIRV